MAVDINRRRRRFIGAAAAAAARLGVSGSGQELIPLPFLTAARTDTNLSTDTIV